MVPDRMTIRITTNHNAFHVVRKDIFRDTQPFECVDHADEQIFLLGIREELNIPLASVVTDHYKAGNFIWVAMACIHVHKAPIHLVTLTGITGVTTATIAL